MTAAALTALLAIGAAGCGSPGHSVGEIPEPDTQKEDGLPLMEPVAPPAGDVDRPDEEGEEGGVPKGDGIGSEDGEETGTGDEPDEPTGQEDEDL